MGKSARIITVRELRDELNHLIIYGHGAKTVGFPEGIHGSKFLRTRVEANDTPEDGHPGFIWIEVE